MLSVHCPGTLLLEPDEKKLLFSKPVSAREIQDFVRNISKFRDSLGQFVSLSSSGWLQFLSSALHSTEALGTTDGDGVQSNHVSDSNTWKVLIATSMNCRKTQFLMALFIADDPDLTYEQYIDFRKHIEGCSECAREYEESKYAIELAKRWWPISDDTVRLVEKAGQDYKPGMTVEQGWKDLCRRCPDLAENAGQPSTSQLFLRTGAVAACLLIGMSTWMLFSGRPRPQALPQDSFSSPVVPVRTPSVRVELVANAGRITIPSNERITCAGQSKILLINGKHEMIMHTNTTLTVGPLLENSDIGCLVRLASGRIYTHVEYDSNPFIVDTAHGQVVITGTTFDVEVTDESTILIVDEGTVRFQSPKGAVDVAAGQKSEIVGLSAPAVPLSCNTAELTAWATGYKPESALAQPRSIPGDSYLALSFRKEPVVLGETDYKRWIEEKREWFSKNFPWICELKAALTNEGIEVDYPGLLIESGDVWQFICSKIIPARFSAPDIHSLRKTAISYGFDEEWLLTHVPSARLALEQQSLLPNPSTGWQVFEQWLKYADGSGQAPAHSYVSDACRYIAETRSLIWFAVRNGRYDLTEAKHTQVLTLLQEEVTAACECRNQVLCPIHEQRSSCDARCPDPVESIAKYTEIMKNVEERLRSTEGFGRDL